jgi:hypothetical protein
MFIALVVAAFCLLVVLPLYRLHFRFGWGKSLLATVLTWFAINTLGSLLYAIFRV